MSNKLVKLEDISIDNAPAIYVEDGLKPFISAAREEASEVPDLSTNKGRKRVASIAATVSSSKKAVETVGRAYLKKLKAQPKIIEKELREFVFEMDKLRDETRMPLTEWEAEEDKRIAKEAAEEEARKLDAQKENDHEIALLMNDNFDREAKELAEEAERIAAAEAERIEKERIEYEAELKRRAAEKAEKEKAEAIEREAKAKQDLIDAEAKAKQRSIAAEWFLVLVEAHADNDKFDSDKRAIEAQRIAKENADIAAEKARLDEIARQEAEAETARLAQEELERNKKHVGSIRKAAKESIMGLGFSEDDAKKIVMAIVKNKILNVSINY